MVSRPGRSGIRGAIIGTVCVGASLTASVMCEPAHFVRPERGPDIHVSSLGQRAVTAARLLMRWRAGVLLALVIAGCAAVPARLDTDGVATGLPLPGPNS